MSASRGQQESDVLLFTREKLNPVEMGYEQVKFVFMKLSEWLLTRRQEALNDLMEMLEKLRHLYPRAYETILQQVQARIMQAVPTDPMLQSVTAGPT